MPRATAGFTADVRRAIVSTLAKGGTAQQVARALNLSVRSLQRKLDEHGITFRDLSETVRGQLAEGYLADPRVSISEVAVLLGFSEQSAFNRAFRRWTGETPGRWRKSRSWVRGVDSPSDAKATPGGSTALRASHSSPRRSSASFAAARPRASPAAASNR